MAGIYSSFDKIKTIIEELLTEKFRERVVVNSSNVIGGGCISNASKMETNVGSFFINGTSTANKIYF